MESQPQLSPGELQQDKSPSLIAIFVIFLVMSLVAVSLRIISRNVTHTKLWWDDWLLVLAATLAICQFAFLMEAIKYGLGKHQETVGQAKLPSYLMWTYASEIYYISDLTCVKCSILCLYMRVFSINKRFLKLVYGALAFVILWGFSVLFATIFQCSPIRAAWYPQLPGAKCFNLRAYLIGNNIPNILADFFVILMPVPLVWKLKLSTVRKCGLVLTFLLAFAATGISIARLAYNAGIVTQDATWVYVPAALLSTVEANVGVVCACLPVLAPIVRIVARKSPVSTNPSSGGVSSTNDNERKRWTRRNFTTLDGDSDTNRLRQESLPRDNGFVHNEHYVGNLELGQIRVTKDIEVQRSEPHAIG